jgi:hypothetical protein
MRTDRYTKVVLTLIGIALWALTMTQMGVPVSAATEPAGARRSDNAATEPVGARDFDSVGTEAAGTGSVSRASADLQVLEKPGMEPEGPPAGTSRGPTSILPLRWRVAWAALETGGSDTFCGTAVAVTNTTTQIVNVEVEWMDRFGSSKGVSSLVTAAYLTRVSGVQGNAATINNVPFFHTDYILTTDFTGYALVTADDPRIMVSAFQYCRSDTGYSTATVLSQTNIPAYPVGATADYFRAGIPAEWPPARAALLPEGNAQR